MLYKMILVLIAFGLFGAKLVLADEGCDLIILNEEVAVKCDLKTKSFHPRIERIDGVMIKNLTKYSEQEQVNMKEFAMEDSDILEELIK